MTTLTLDDELAQRLSALAAAQNKTLDDLATETLKRLVESVPYPPQTLADELEGLVGIVDSSAAIPPLPAFGDRSEAAFAEAMEAKYPRRRRDGGIS